ncbi:MAG: MaoC family dehydratase [Pseudomonadota bacterium]
MTAAAPGGRFFEDYAPGLILNHATPRTLTEGDRALYQALYGSRSAVHSSDAFARAAGLGAAPLDDLIVFHTVFGKSVPDVSLNAVANLGYAEGRFLAPARPGATLAARSEVIGVKETSSGKTGIVWVRTEGRDETGALLLTYVRWVLVRKRDPGAPPPAAEVPTLASSVAPEDLVPPTGFERAGFDLALAGGTRFFEDYAPGEVIDHSLGTTVEEAEHMMATRLWQNTARVHFDGTLREDGRRLVYGGHVLSHARALAFNGLEATIGLAAINAGTHVNPCFAGTTIFAWSEVLDTAETSHPGLGALRLRLVATSEPGRVGALREESGRYLGHVLLDFDHWVFVPRR